ncbi:hypothetical protein CsSME_00020078 [Camellia sinensis var. sinensis]
MGRSDFKVLKGKRDGFSDLGLQWSLPEGSYHPGGLFASVGQVGNNMGFGISPNSPNSLDNNGGFKLPYTDLYVKYVSSPEGFRIVGVPEGTEEEGLRKKKSGMKLKIKIANPASTTHQQKERERERKKKKRKKKKKKTLQNDVVLEGDRNVLQESATEDPDSGNECF